MPTIIEGRFGIGYRQSPYLFNSIGFKVEIAEGNILEGVTAKSNYINYNIQKLIEKTEKEYRLFMIIIGIMLLIISIYPSKFIELSTRLFYFLMAIYSIKEARLRL